MSDTVTVGSQGCRKMTQDSENSQASRGSGAIDYLGANAPPPNTITASHFNSMRTRAISTRGYSHPAVYREVCRALRELRPSPGTMVDIGCGSGQMGRYASSFYSTYLGVDLIQYEDFPNGAAFVVANLNADSIPLASECADIVAAIDVIEYLENPRTIMRELTRLARPSGIIILSTKNHLSLLSKLNLVIRNRFVAFNGGAEDYPTAITALLEFDLVRMARECDLMDLEVRYTNQGRVPFSSFHWPGLLGFRGRNFSDNVVLIARKRAGVTSHGMDSKPSRAIG